MRICTYMYVFMYVCGDFGTAQDITLRRLTNCFNKLCDVFDSLLPFDLFLGMVQEPVVKSL